jgi:thioredoxin-dependent peroxiredoxin
MRSLGFFIILGVCAVVGSNSMTANGKGKDKPTPKVELKVKVGEAAPTFESTDEAGAAFKSSDVVGKKIVVLFFYPADFASNSVAEVRGFQEEIDNLNKQGAVVVGVSGDSASTHKLFKAYYKLPFALLADEKGDVAKAFGIPVGPGGKSPTINAKDERASADRAVTLERWTVVIDKAGKIAAADPVPSPIKGATISGEAKRVAELIKKLDTK